MPYFPHRRRQALNKDVHFASNFQIQLLGNAFYIACLGNSSLYLFQRRMFLQ